jgi:CheY-like chemotaxis protein
MARVLVIDDDAKLRELLRAALEQGGHEVTETADGEAGLRACLLAAQDLVLCDLLMPNRGGLGTIQQLQARHPGLRVVAMSGAMAASPSTRLG